MTRRRRSRGRLVLFVAACAAAALVGASRYPAVAQDCVVIEDFTKTRVGAFPEAWKPRKDAGRSVYSVHEEGGRRFLRALAENVGIQAAREYEWDIGAYPILAWSWRLRQFPRGGDERQGKTNDSALAVYAVFPHTRVSLKSVKYIWSERVPKGTHLTSSQGLTQARVLRTGGPSPGGWADERVNVLEDYTRYFETTDVPKAAGIAVLTDSDDTKSSAQGDYANFRACRR